MAIQQVLRQAEPTNRILYFEVGRPAEGVWRALCSMANTMQSLESRSATSGSELRDLVGARRTFAHSVQFKPPWYLRNGHVQTILGQFINRPKKSPRFRRYEVPLMGGGATYLYDSQPEETRAEYTVLLAHGLGGSHASPYMIRITDALMKAGIRVIRVDLPGSGPAAEISDRAAHAGCSHDLLMIMQWAAEHLQVQRWRVAGFSLGGNITLKLLSELPSLSSANSVQIEKALVVAPPVDLAFCCRRIEKGLNAIYNQFFLRILKRLARERSVRWTRWRDLHQANRNRLRSLRQFDNVYTAPIAGFRDASDYYERCSTFSLLELISTPTTVLIDSHDPIVPASLFDTVAISPSIQVLRTDQGGHLGYLHRTPSGKLTCWMDEWVVRELQEAPAIV